MWWTLMFTVDPHISHCSARSRVINSLRSDQKSPPNFSRLSRVSYAALRGAQAMGLRILVTDECRQVL